MPGYLDLDSIMAEEERVPCKFLKEANGLGFLDPNSEQDWVAGKSQTSQIQL